MASFFCVWAAPLQDSDVRVSDVPCRRCANCDHCVACDLIRHWWDQMSQHAGMYRRIQELHLIQSPVAVSSVGSGAMSGAARAVEA